MKKSTNAIIVTRGVCCDINIYDILLICISLANVKTDFQNIYAYMFLYTDLSNLRIFPTADCF